jgi:hypothetical protein
LNRIVKVGCSWDEASLAAFVAAKAKHDASIAYYRETFGPDVEVPDVDGYEKARAALDKSLDPILNPSLDDTLKSLATKEKWPAI